MHFAWYRCWMRKAFALGARSSGLFGSSPPTPGQKARPPKCSLTFTAIYCSTFRTSTITSQQLCSRSLSKNFISQVVPFSSSYHEIFITVWGQHQRDDDLVTEQWCLFMLQHLVQSVQLSREQGKAVQDRGPGGSKKVSAYFQWSSLKGVLQIRNTQTHPQKTHLALELDWVGTRVSYRDCGVRKEGHTFSFWQGWRKKTVHYLNGVKNRQ